MYNTPLKQFLMVCDNTGSQGLGYGTISPTHKTTTTHSAITDQAGLAHINTGNFKQADVQHELNELITSDFDKEQVLRDLNAQTVISTEFGKEAPQRVAEFSQKQSQSLLQELDNPSLTTKEATQIIEEAKKWEEGGIYRVALHTAVGALGTGTVEGAVTTGGVAAAAPTINAVSKTISQKLINQGVSQDKAEAATNLITSLAITAATQSAGANTTSTAMAVNVDANNRWLHDSEIEKIFGKDGTKLKQFAKEQGVSYEEAWRAVLAQAYRNADDKFRESHQPSATEKESQLSKAAENFLRKNDFYIKSTSQERANDWQNTNTTKYKVLLNSVLKNTPKQTQQQVNNTVLKQAVKTSAVGTVKGVGNIPSDAANSIANVFHKEVSQTFPYNNEEEANVGAVAQNVVGVGTVFIGTKAPYKKVSSGGTIELFTDNSGPKIKGALGVGPTDPNAIASDARSMPSIPTGSQAQVIANNPYIPKSAGGNFTIMDYLPEATRITQKNGIIVINGSASNKYLRGIPSESELSKMGLKLEYNGPLKPEYQHLQFKDSNGKILKNHNMKTIIFKKVK